MTGAARLASSATEAGTFGRADLRLHCAGRFLSGVALNIQSVAIGWHLYAITGSALALGFSGLASFLPSALLAPITGHVADAHDRKTILAVAFVLCALAQAALVALVAARVRDVLPIYGCVAFVGAARAFANPAAQALTPSLAPRESLAKAVTWYSSSWSAANILGPALGGILYLFGPETAFVCGLATFFAAAVCVFLIRARPRAGAAREPVRWRTLSAGLAFIRSRQVVFGAVTLDMVAVLFGGATALLPIVAKENLHAGPLALGLLRASPAIGAVAMGAALARLPIASRAGKKMLAAVGVYGLATIAFGFSSHLALSMLLLAVVGAADQISVVVRHTMVQAETPDDMRGRVAAVNSIFIGATTDLGEFESGLTAAWFGVIPAIVLGGAATVLVACAWAALFPRLRDRDALVEA